MDGVDGVVSLRVCLRILYLGVGNHRFLDDTAGEIRFARRVLRSLP